MAIFKNTATKIGLVMTKTDGTADTTSTPTVVISKDGGATASKAGAAQVAGTNLWSLDLLAADTNADLVMVQATAAGCVPFTVVIYPESTWTATRAGYLDTSVNGLLNTQTLAELAQGVPPAAPTVAQALMLLYMAARDGVKDSNTYHQIVNSAGTVIAKAPLSDDGTTFTRGKLVSGP